MKKDTTIYNLGIDYQSVKEMIKSGGYIAREPKKPKKPSIWARLRGK